MDCCFMIRLLLLLLLLLFAFVLCFDLFIAVLVFLLHGDLVGFLKGHLLR